MENLSNSKANNSRRGIFGKKPEFEKETHADLMHYLQHGFPSPLVRWHCHEEYELHLIISTQGKVFVGDYIGTFSPGHLVLTGPRLPHNWISTDVSEGTVPLRDMVLQFSSDPLEKVAKSIPELQELLPLLQRSMHGVEFFGLGSEAEQHLLSIREKRGIERFAEFVKLMAKLARADNYRLLSSARMQSHYDDAAFANVSAVLDYITENYRERISAGMIAEKILMSRSKFTRFFREATGNSFTDFLNRVRINKACELLMNTDQLVTYVCYDVGFNNVANFNRRFLEFKGMTPAEFRRNANCRFGMHR